MLLLKIQYNGPPEPIIISEMVRCTLRTFAENHLWKTIISKIILDCYTVAREGENQSLTSYLEWGVLLTTHLLGFGVIRLIIGSCDIFNMSLKEFNAVTLCGETLPEIMRLIEPIKEVIKTPTPQELKKWIYLKWSGMFSDTFFPAYKMRNNKYIASICAGVLDGASPDQPPVQHVSFPTSSYVIDFYAFGRKLAGSCNQTAISQPSSRMKDFISKAGHRVGSGNQ